ncbi:MAG TPA: hypothetical protein DCS17_07075 [Flavobacterium sp.]|nr:hypothetical protein [Flavobacterium sp.]
MKLMMWILIIITDLIFSEYKLGLINQVDSFDKMETYLFWSITSFFYYTITETFLSRSLAKYFTKTIVVLKDGSKPKSIDILARSALRQIPFEYFTFFQGRKPGWHDEYSNTFVVKKDKLEQILIDYKELFEIEKQK